MSEWDLTSKMAPYCDRHMVIPLLEFLSEKGVCSEDDLLQARLHLLFSSHMVDYLIDVFSKLYPDKEIPAEMRQKREEVVKRFDELREDTSVFHSIYTEPEFQHKVDTCTDPTQLVEFLAQEYNFKPEMIDTCYYIAKFQYECGQYGRASDFLYFYRLVAQVDDKHYMDALWGSLASEILGQKWDKARESLKRLQQFIDETSFGSPSKTLQQRTWLIHWSLFVFFNVEKGCDALIEMLLYQKTYLNAIQTTCPWILRYVAVAVVVMHRDSRSTTMKELLRVLGEEVYTYQDPITSFLLDVHTHFDFNGAQIKLRQCEVVMANDFFLFDYVAEFVENARLIIFGTFCRLHACISIDSMATKLNMAVGEAERWIVKLIRETKLDAKIDARRGHVIMGGSKWSSSTPYQQLIERTKLLNMRTQMLQMTIEKKKKAHDQPRWGADVGF